MTTNAITLPSRQWSIVALGTAGMAAVFLSYALAFLLAVGCLVAPVLLLVSFSFESFMVARLALSAFGIVSGLTILWSLLPQREKIDVNGVLIDLSKEKRLSQQIESIAEALHEPMPSEVYLLGDANAFVVESRGFLGFGKRRIIGLGLPLLQMLTIAQFRAVLAHEFAHYYAGDTRLGPWVYNTRRAIARVYENLGHKSDVIKFLTRWAVVAIPYMILMATMRGYWNVFMRITQWISRRQEYRSDELACHIAGSQALAEGLSNLPRCQAVLNAYWNTVVLPVAASGFQPQLGEGFMRFVTAPHIARATTEFLEKDDSKPSAMDSHPPLDLRMERARVFNLPAPDYPGQPSDSSIPMISLIDDLASLEGGLLKRVVPSLAETDLKPVSWDAAGMEVLVPAWRKQVANHEALLAKTRLQDLPDLVQEPRHIANKIANPPGMFLGPTQRDARAWEVLFDALVTCLLDNGWTLHSQPGTLYLENGETKLDPGQVITEMKSGKLTLLAWQTYCAQKEMGGWPLARISVPPAVA